MKIENAKIRESSELNRKHSSGERLSIMLQSKRYEISHLDVTNLIPYYKQARRVFDEAELKSLADTIKEHGIRQPLTVVRSKDNDNKFEVISGERRLRAAKIVGLKNIPCIIHENYDQAEEIALIENIQRTDLHPVELSAALKLLVEKIGWGGQKELSEKIGLSNSKISELLKLNELSSLVRETMLKTNFRGRQNFRKLFKINSDDKKLEFINSLMFADKKDKVSQSKQKVIPILRISRSDNRFKIDKSTISKLSNEEKSQLKIQLMKIIEEL
ncbi:ParB/RepB/Spo0J family partition protein [Candidatus Odyssella thessalonicensis]|uniref:ParB/RepB/Spo0J family partition protein n=1 Tax=Candidatus Odyssella thessalonicensis TaxID=84647 RepID=UPI00031EB985|nr:ParB/RepB/Spo0J family partition protein [Candidatus Odyssella thessalonicensis]